MNYLNRIIFLVILTPFFAQPVIAQRPFHLLTGIVISSLSTYDIKHQSFQQGAGINVMFVGITYTLEHPTLLKEESNDLNQFIGFAITHLIQLQYGFSGSFRFRSDIVTLNKYSPWFSYMEDERWNMLRKGIVISVIGDRHLSWTDRSWSLGLGVGVYL